MTAPHILAQRHDAAVQRIEARAKSIGGKNPEAAKAIEAVRDVRGPDEEHIRVFRLEAIADLQEVMEGKGGGLESVEGIGPELAHELRQSGYETPDDLRAADDEDLLEVEGIGKAKLKAVRSQI